MATDGISGALSGLATGGGNNGSLKNVGFDTFLKLLVTQLQNQDPLNPMDGTQFTGQIAQFSQLEQQIAGNTYLEDLSKARDYGIQSIATSYLGKEVMVPGSGIDKTDTGAEFGFEVEENAASVEIEIYKPGTGGLSGEVVRTLKLSAQQAGAHLVEWDGKDDAGVAVANGEYSLRINAVDTEGTKVVAGLYAYDVVSEVTSVNGDVGLKLASGGTAIFDDVLAVRPVTSVQ